MTVSKQFDFDLIVIGGGSGGIAASREAANRGKKVALCDFVKPTPIGTKWGVGGTCVNVGCIPKKLMHKAASLNMDFSDASAFGWDLPLKISHDWSRMVEEIQKYIKSLNFGYRKIFREKNITYFNAMAQFVHPNRIKITDKNDCVKEITGYNFVIAVGCRPRYLNIPGAEEYGITSDDLFSLPYNPGRTLIVGASYVALEIAGILNALGNDCTIMARSILLRGFDQQMANMVGDHLISLGVKIMLKCIPTSIEKLLDGEPRRLKVTAKQNDDIVINEYSTVLFAIGRDPCTKDLGLKEIGVKMNCETGRIVCNNAEQSSIGHIYAIGDVVDGRPELTPVAVHAGKLLSQRIFGESKTLTDYTKVATTVFTPLEYGCVGLSEEDAFTKIGEENIDVYHTHFQPLEFVLTNRNNNVCYGKLICDKTDDERIVGFHVFGPNAAEITQGYALALNLGAKKADFDRLIGIHPTCAEEFTMLRITKASKLDIVKTGC